MKVISKLLICVVLAIGAAACLSGNEEKSGNAATGGAGTNTSNANRLDEQSSAVIPPSPDTLTAALARIRKDKIETVSSSEVFKKDDGIRLKISAVENGFVTVLYRGSNNQYLKLFPHESYNKGKNSIASNQVLEIPDRGWLFFDEKKGVETIFVVYSRYTIPRQLSAEPKQSIALLEKLRSENKNADAFTTADGDLIRIIELTHE